MDREKEETVQFLFPDLVAKFKQFLPDDYTFSKTYLKKKIIDHYKDEILTIESPSRPLIFCLKGSCLEFIKNSYELKNATIEQQKTNIVNMCAKILKEEIRSKFFPIDEYPTVQEVQSGNVQNLPILFLKFLGDMTGKDPSDRKVISAANSLIATTRPRSFLSPVLLGVGIYIHRKYGSKNLIEVLSALGFSENYKEILKFEATASCCNQYNFAGDAFQQFVFDNADFNVKTIDGYGTFHSMGGIVCISPEASCFPPGDMNRPKKVPNVLERSVDSPVTSIKIYPYQKNVAGLKQVAIKDIRFSLSVGKETRFNLKNSLWFSAFLLDFNKKPSQNGFMANTVCGEFQNTKILPLPFINLDPGNLNTIYSALLFAQGMCERNGQSICIVTFDQPLYIKAAEMVAAAESTSPLRKVVVRLGGFHMLMFFLGSVGFIMSGSGLEDLWGTIYAKNSIPAMVTGHSYARSLRAHFLTQLALLLILIKSEVSLFENVDRDAVESAFFSSSIEGSSFEFQHGLANSLDKAISEESSNSRTSKLWCEYIHQINLVKMFIYAERSADFEMHLYSVQKMIPFFHSAGHTQYAKCSHLYLQQMQGLKETLQKSEYDQFMEFFTVRRTKKFWSGVWTDMTIEQVLMRSLKAQEGLTHGRGLTDANLAKWVLSMPTCTTFCEALETFANVKAVYSEQHVELRPSKEKRDVEDLNHLTDWLEVHNPFGRDSNKLVSLTTGIVAEETINCDRAKEIGENAYISTIGNNFQDLKLKRSAKVKSLGFANKTLKVYDQVVPVNQTQLFNRITCSCLSTEDLKKCFKYELAPYPVSIIENGLLRKTAKSALLTYMDKKCKPLSNVPTNGVFVIDGGYILHKVVWQIPSTYADIFGQYKKFIQFHYGSNCTVVFDGYDGLPSTKSLEQMRRTNKLSCADIVICDSAVATVNQEKFFSNTNNKKMFIKLLIGSLLSSNISVKQAEADADVLIVQTAFNLREKETSVIVVGQDTDLMVLLLHFVKKNNVFMLRPGNQSQATRITEISLLQEALGPVVSEILFIHEIGGCDTTSAMYKQGKLKPIKVLEGNKTIHSLISGFQNVKADKEEIIKIGEEFLLLVYGKTKISKTLNDLRFYKYNNITARQNLKSNFELATLPPTSDAAKYHCLRVYYQIQQWLGNNLNPLEFGWERFGEILRPKTMDSSVAPEFILKMIYCNCKSGCKKSCTCKKSNIFCSNLCGQCNGTSCQNIPSITLDETNDSDLEI